MRNLSLAALLAAGVMVVAGAGPAAAAGGLLPHPGPDGLVGVEEMTGDGGVASGGAWEGLPTVLTAVCEGGGVDVAMESQGYQVADFTVDCPAGIPGAGPVVMDAGVVRSGSFAIGVDASDERVRWALTVPQSEHFRSGSRFASAGPNGSGGAAGRACLVRAAAW